MGVYREHLHFSTEIDITIRKTNVLCLLYTKGWGGGEGWEFTGSIYILARK